MKTQVLYTYSEEGIKPSLLYKTSTKTPGPSEYSNVNFIALAPQYSFTSAKKLFERKNNFPGPCSYKIDANNNHMKSLSYSFKKNEVRKRILLGPSPGDYDIQDFIDNNKGYTVGGSKRFLTSESISPGPGAYEILMNNRKNEKKKIIISNKNNIKGSLKKIIKNKLEKNVLNSIKNNSEKSFELKDEKKKSEKDEKKSENDEKITNKSENSINNIEENYEKKNLKEGITFSKSVRKFEFLDERNIDFNSIRSPGPAAYNIKRKLNRTGFHLDKSKKKEVFKGNQNPAPNSYQIPHFLEYLLKKKKKISIIEEEEKKK